eukprot:TRINITY_DN28364_c0_g1_i2.p2 TRINITY_DN28364_c0_g1~~TRINITY_DN28364_c0_g1_i2.p2  ORF type:complete len:157 (-),score=22.04 TRINITY_DN28364_c0_g1_i2:104-574(-)
MADSYHKKEREKKRRKRKQEKRERKEQRKLEGKSEEFMYVDENGNLTSTPQDLTKKEVKLEEIEIGVPKKDDSDPQNSERAGKVKFFNTEKGYGFIIDKETNESYFVHVNNLETEIDSNDEVSYEIGNGPKGLVALNVHKLKSSKQKVDFDKYPTN